jgi:hypothetical protein
MARPKGKIQKRDALYNRPKFVIDSLRRSQHEQMDLSRVESKSVKKSAIFEIDKDGNIIVVNSKFKV